ncbi:MAG: FAD:protein FMN transferase [Wenzhouxiangella sp.]|nr:FAD:protein FMN transferase [Wenzhouxiangella sp.]
MQKTLIGCMTRLRRLAMAALACICLALATACGRTPESVLIQGPIMGTTYTVRVQPEAGLPAGPELQAQIQNRLETLNARLSTWVESSDVVRFNRAEADLWFPVSADTVAVVSAAQRIAQASEGAFDITVGPLVDLWGFGPLGQPERVPQAAEIERLLAATGYQMLEVRTQPPAMRKSHPELSIDLSAIAKGYAVDELVVLLDREGYLHFMVEIGGEVRTRGLRPDGRPWRIALEKPLRGSREVLRVIPLSDRAVASSGDYRNYFEYDGRRYSHTIDPRTGWPVAHGLGAASVVADTCMSADAWATALMVLGADAGLRLAQEQGLAANLIVATEAGFDERMTEAYQALANP